MKPAPDVLLIGHAYAPGGVLDDADGRDTAVGPRASGRVSKIVSCATTASMSRPRPSTRCRSSGSARMAGVRGAAKRFGPSWTRSVPGLSGGQTRPSRRSIAAEPRRPGRSHFFVDAETTPGGPFGRRSSLGAAAFDAGTYDDQWQTRRAPYLPEDFDARFFQLAPTGLVAASILKVVSRLKSSAPRRRDGLR